MKKTYIIPKMYCLVLKPAKQILNSSPGVTGSNGAGYGGVDDGTHDPSAPGYYDNIDDDEDW